MRDPRSTPQTDRIDALIPVLGTLFAGLAMAIALLVIQPGMMS